MPEGRTGAVREADVRAMLGFVAELGSLERRAEFRQGVLPGLRDLVPCEIATFNELQFEMGTMVSAEAVDDPPGAVFAEAPELFVRLGHQNPLVDHYQRTRDGRPFKWSDFIDRRKLHASELYRETYRPMKVEHQMAFALPTPPELTIAFALNRERKDFSERDRRLLNLIRPPLIQAYRTVERYETLARRLETLERGLQRGGAGIVVLESDRQAAAYVSVEAAEAFARACGTGRGQLPEVLTRWLASLPDHGIDPASIAPLVLEEHDGARAIAHFLPARHTGDSDALLVQRVGDQLSLSVLRAAGLTARQAEVLRLLALGRTNPRIAAELSISARTVDKHLEHIYEQLGARSRTQAALTAWSLVRAS